MSKNIQIKSSISLTFSLGMAMFAMLFGAGNVVFSLALGRDSGDMVWWAIGGFIITAVLVPMLGLVSAILFEGNYIAFLNRIGPVPGAIVAFACLILIGPFGGIPRCVTTAFAAVKWYTPDFSLLHFSILASLIIYLLTFKRSSVVDLIGKFLGPIKLILLLAIIVVGLFFMEGAPAVVDLTSSSAMFSGMTEGYSTMDLLAALFFASLIFANLKQKEPKSQPCLDLVKGFKAALFGAFLLGIVYTGFCLVAAFHGSQVVNIDRYELLNALAPFILGPRGGLLTNAAVAISCLVTAIALTAVFAEYLHRVIFVKQINYLTALAITVFLSGCMTNLGFHGIMSIIAPCVIAFYPALIVLAIFNILNKLFGVKQVVIPVFVTFALTGLFQFVL
ncbi:MAG: branched-chain amino acid transport system II carrier protein [bacterium]|nr:branched-chain amino acid transport system II carrier protein [bacterium]